MKRENYKAKYEELKREYNYKCNDLSRREDIIKDYKERLEIKEKECENYEWNINNFYKKTINHFYEELIYKKVKLQKEIELLNDELSKVLEDIQKTKSGI